MNIPYNGIYYVNFSVQADQAGGVVIAVIAKNGGASDLNITGVTLADAYTTPGSPSASMSATSYFTTNDTVSFGFFSTANATISTQRTIITIALLHRTA